MVATTQTYRKQTITINKLMGKEMLMYSTLWLFEIFVGFYLIILYLCLM
jgi:hypothetical protein